MGKNDSYIVQKILFYDHLLLWRNYHAAPKRFKLNDSTAVDSNDDENEMDYLSENSGSEADW